MPDKVVAPQRVVLGGTALFVLALMVLYTDQHTPLGFAHGLLYLPLLLLAFALRNQRLLLAMLIVSAAATWIGVWLSPPPPDGFPLSHVYGNRLLSTAALVAVYFSARYFLLNRHRWEQDVASSREELRYFEELADNLPTQIWAAGPDGHLTRVGRKFVRFIGMPENWLLEHWPEVLHPDDRERALATWAASVDSGEPYRIEFRIRRADGEYVWHLTSAEPSRDDKGRIVRWIGSAIDITSIKALEEQSSALASKLTTMVESITDAFLTFDWEARFTYINSRAAAILDVDPVWVRGRQARMLLDPASTDPFSEHFRRARESGESQAFIAFYAHRQVWLDVRAYPSSDGVAVYFRDITDERRSQEELTLLRTAVSRLNDIIMITEAEPVQAPGPRILFVNEAFERVTGYPASEVIGRDPRLLQGPKTQPRELARIRSALKKWQPVRAQLINYTLDGRELWLELDIVPIADERGWYTHWVAVERDITAQKQLQQHLENSQRLESVGRLTGGIAHDFNNLLTVILGNADLLVEQLQGQQALQSLARLVVAAAERGSSLTRSLLAFSQRQPLSPEVIVITDMLQELQPILQSSLGESNELGVDTESHLWPVVADRAQLESALLNLAINARDAMADRGRVAIQVSNCRLDAAAAAALDDELAPGDYVRLCVQDNGCGIAAEHLNRIFEPFYSTKPPDKGSGLGLSMVFGFIKQSGGHVTVESVPDLGTTFCLYLPRSPASAEPAAGPDPAPEHTPASQTILLVEDNESIRQLACAYLQSGGYRVITADNGDDAKALIDTGEPFDLLFTDIVMPGSLSGAALARYLRQQRPQTPVLFTSGFTADEIPPDRWGMQDVAMVSKPYRRDPLLQQVAAALANDPPLQGGTP